MRSFKLREVQCDIEIYTKIGQVLLLTAGDFVLADLSAGDGYWYFVLNNGRIAQIYSSRVVETTDFLNEVK